MTDMAGELKTLAPFCDFLGGVERVREALVDALRHARSQARLSCDELDQRCGFGNHEHVLGAGVPRPSSLPPRKSPRAKLPSSLIYEADPNGLTARAFSIASQVLGVEVDAVLEPLFTHEQRRAAQEMLQTRGSLATMRILPSGGPTKVPSIAPQEAVQFLVFINALAEIDRVAPAESQLPALAPAY